MTNWEGCTNSAPRTGDAFDLMGMTMTFRFTGKDTGGKFSITEQLALPGARPTFLHGHPAEETFIVLDGEFEVWGHVDGKKASKRMGPGHIHHVTSNAPHAIQNVGSKTGRVLLVFHPADLQEALFKDLGKPTSAAVDPAPEEGPFGPEAMAVLGPIFKKHKLTVLE